MKPDQNDPVIDEIREIRHRISERFDHDPARLVAYYMELQEKYRDRMIDAKKIPYTEERDQLLPSWDSETLVRKARERRNSPGKSST
jgi:hypothetical protein